MRPRRPKQCCLQLVMYLFIYFIVFDFCGGEVMQQDWHLCTSLYSNYQQECWCIFKMSQDEPRFVGGVYCCRASAGSRPYSWSIWDFWFNCWIVRWSSVTAALCSPGSAGILKTTRSFLKIPEEVRSQPKTSEVCERRSYRQNAYPQNQRSRGRYCHLLVLHMVFVPYMGLS